MYYSQNCFIFPQTPWDRRLCLMASEWSNGTNADYVRLLSRKSVNFSLYSAYLKSSVKVDKFDSGYQRCQLVKNRRRYRDRCHVIFMPSHLYTCNILHPSGHTWLIPRGDLQNLSALIGLLPLHFCCSRTVGKFILVLLLYLNVFTDFMNANRVCNLEILNNSREV
jgi:hypothetical protein